MTKREEIKKVLRQNTKDAFKAIKLNMAGKEEFTAKELAEMTEGRLSTKSISTFFAKNGSYIIDRAGGGDNWMDDIVVSRRKRKRDRIKTYGDADQKEFLCFCLFPFVFIKYCQTFSHSRAF